MVEKLKNIFNKIKEQFSKLDTKKKIIFSVIIGIVIFVSIYTFKFTGSRPESLLFEKPLTVEDYGKITAQLTKSGIQFRTKDDKYIIVQDRNTASKVRMELAQKQLLPAGTKGWEIFDMQKWTTTDFERNINLRRALVGEMKRHLEMLDWIENVSIDITMPEKKLYTEQDYNVRASVVITPKPYSEDYLKNKKIIKGIENIVVSGIDKLKRQNVVISDNYGNILNDFTDDQEFSNIRKVKEQNKIKIKLASRIKNDINNALSKVLTQDRFRVNVDMILNFDQESYEEKQILPVVLKKDNPNTPYDDSKIVETVPVSEKTVTEDFKGQGFVPEGPPGTEPNLPPGYKENLDKWNTYKKNSKTINHNSGYRNTKVKKDPYSIKKVSIAVYVDGTWEKIYDKENNPIFKNGTYQRKYISYPDDDLKKLSELIKGAINYNSSRGDLVVVKNIKFDRTKSFAIEDAKYRQQENIKKTIFLSLIILLSLFVGTLVFRVIKKELARRRRLKEQELARKQALMRESILKDAEETSPEDELSPEEKQRLDLQEKANRISQENPEVVAKLLRTWLAEE